MKNYSKSYLILVLITLFSYINARSESLNISSSIALKVPGNNAVRYNLIEKNIDGKITLASVENNLPVTITRHIENNASVAKIIFEITASEDVYFNFKQLINSAFSHNSSWFYMPGFWYRQNLRSPKEAPSFHTSDSWTVREDRLSTPLTGIFNRDNGDFISVMRIEKSRKEALTTHNSGEIIVSGVTSLGYTGFENTNGNASLSFGYPYQETPKTYIRKLTLSSPVEAFQLLKKGSSVQLVWEIKKGKAIDFSDFVKQMWEYSYDTNRPETVNTGYSNDFVKEVLTSYFTESLVTNHALKYNSGEGLRVDLCERKGSAEVGFVGRVLLNAFNAMEYGYQKNRNDLVDNSLSVFYSYLQHGFTANGFFKEYVDFDRNYETDVFSIRRQSEGIYAMFHYLKYEKDNGRKHPEWEAKLKTILNNFLLLQNPDGSFPRKFKDDMSVIDKSGGSTPSATLPLVMGYVYFKDKRYLASAKKTAEYLENEIISKSDYFSSTLDANCEDKEASLYAATATYYLSLISKGKEQQKYADLTRKSAYFALSWYYTWDVPFAQGQMIGDIGLKTRGWGNVSVENNHIDVFIFEFGSVLNWLSKQYSEPRFSEFSKVISSSMRQLLPYEGHMCGVAKRGYYPEVVQHTNWDYGKNGKGFYNDIFAPGWTVASLWELLTPGRAEEFLTKKTK
ncbi:MAG: hypothetical protein ACYC2P_07480 [Paludibacteraceae bacterium]